MPRLACLALVGLTALAAHPAGALANHPGGTGPVERVSDGSFEGMNCLPGGCVSSVWDASASALGPGAAAIGPLCGEAATPGTDCEEQGSGYTSAFNWVRLGAGSGPENEPVGIVGSSVEQEILIPAAFIPQHPAILRFNLRIINAPNSNGSMAVNIGGGGGTQVFGIADTAAGHTNYAQVTVDLSAFAGPGPKLLQFEGVSAHVAHGVSTANEFYDSFDVDDISVDAADPLTAPMTPPVTPGVSSTPGTTATGQRAAALAKCKRKRGKARKKCRKRAALLPV